MSATDRPAAGGWPATHRHPIYGRVRLLHTQHGVSRIHDGWHAWSVPATTLTPVGRTLATRDGAYMVVSSAWDSNGSWSVVVRGPWPNTERGARKARDLARRVDRMGRVRWTRLNKVTSGPSGGGHCKPPVVHYHLTVSRLERS